MYPCRHTHIYVHIYAYTYYVHIYAYVFICMIFCLLPMISLYLSRLPNMHQNINVNINKLGSCGVCLAFSWGGGVCVALFYWPKGEEDGRAASGGALAPEPPRATGVGPESLRFCPFPGGNFWAGLLFSVFFSVFLRSDFIHCPISVRAGIWAWNWDIRVREALESLKTLSDFKKSGGKKEKMGCPISQKIG